MRRPIVVLIGDLRGSRDLEDRAGVQSRMQGILEDLTNELRDDLLTPLTLTAGDEVQGVFLGAAATVTAIQELTDRLYGSGAQLRPTRGADGRLDWGELPRTEIAFGIGRGTLSTGEGIAGFDAGLNPALLDGPAFHQAREALERTKKEGAWVSFAGFDAGPQAVLDALFELMGAIRRDWATAQWVYTHVRRHVELQKDVAQQLQVTGSVVSQSLKAAHYEAVLRGEDAARAVLGTVGGQS